MQPCDRTANFEEISCILGLHGLEYCVQDIFSLLSVCVRAGHLREKIIA